MSRLGVLRKYLDEATVTLAAIKDIQDEYSKTDDIVNEEQIATLAEIMLVARTLKETCDSIKGKTENIYRVLTDNVVPRKMEDIGSTLMRFEGIGRLGVKPDCHCSVPKGNGPAVQQWMRDNGYKDLIKESINSSTLKAEIKRMVIEGEEYPIDLVKFTPFMRATITKS